MDGGSGRLVFSLSPTATLLTLAAHLGESHLLWIYDIHLLISREESRIDWEELAARADEFRWSRALRASLADARYHFGTAIPGGLLSAIDQDVATGRVHQLQDLEGSRRPVWTLRILTQLPWRKRLWLFRIPVFPGRQTMMVRYKPDPTWLWPLFYLVRWFGFAWKSVRSARHLLRS